MISWDADSEAAAVRAADAFPPSGGPRGRAGTRSDSLGPEKTWDRGKPELIEHLARPSAPHPSSNPAGPTSALAGRLGLEAVEVAVSLAPPLRASLQVDLGARSWRWGECGGGSRSLELPSPRFPRKPRSALANAGIYLHSSIFTPPFRAPPGAPGELGGVWG